MVKAHQGLSNDSHSPTTHVCWLSSPAVSCSHAPRPRGVIVVLSCYNPTTQHCAFHKSHEMVHSQNNGPKTQEVEVAFLQHLSHQQRGQGGHSPLDISANHCTSEKGTLFFVGKSILLILTGDDCPNSLKTRWAPFSDLLRLTLASALSPFVFARVTPAWRMASRHDTSAQLWFNLRCGWFQTHMLYKCDTASQEFKSWQCRRSRYRESRKEERDATNARLHLFTSPAE